MNSDLGYWCISGKDLLTVLRRAARGEDADLLYAELYANADVDCQDNET